MISNIIEKIKEHKIIAITIAAAIAVIVVLVILLSSPSQRDENSQLKAISRGSNTKCATVVLKADLPDGYYWHLGDFDNEFITVKVKKENSKKFKFKIRGINTGGYTIGVTADSYPNFKSEEEEEEYILSHDAEQLQYRETLLSMVVDFSVDDKKKVIIDSIEAMDLISDKPLIDDMLYPISFIASNEDIQLIIKNEATDWTIECSNELNVFVGGPYKNTNGEEVFVVKPTTDGIATVRLVDYSVNYGIEFTAVAYSMNLDEEGKETTDLDKIASTKKYIKMENEHIIGGEELIINYDELDMLEEVREAVKKIPLPVGAVVKDAYNMGQVDSEGKYDEDGKDLSNMELKYLNKVLDYVVTEKQTPEEILAGVDEYMTQIGTVKSIEKMGDIDVILYSMPNGKADEDVEEGEKPISYLACWQFEGITCMLQEANSTYNFLNKFVTTLELR